MTNERFLSDTFLFSGIEERIIAELVGGSTIVKKFEKGELIYSNDSEEKMIGFVKCGECVVTDALGRVPINTLTTHASFGITAVFSDEDFPTYIYAKKVCTVLFFKKEDLFRMMSILPDISKNIIAFLVNRITFLNKKISTFCADSVEKKLAAHLMDKRKTFGDSFELNLKQTADEISSGRASLYRALASLESEQIIYRNAKKITVINVAELERITKQ